MKKRLIKAIFALSAAALMLPSGVAMANPFISISSSGGDSLSISVSGGYYNQQIDLVYTLPGSSLPTTVSNIATTSGGYWNGTLNLDEYGIVPGSQVYVRVAGQQSNTITVGGSGSGCTYNCGNPYNLSLSQTNVYLSVGQSQAVTIYNNNYNNNYYISSNSNPNVVSAAVNSGNQIGLYGLANGSSTVTVCMGSNYNNYDYNNGCASIYVSVSGSVQGSSNYNVSIRDNFYSPQTITIPAGSSITWRNDGSMQHTVTFNNPYSDSGTMHPGSVYTKTFLTPGTYTYYCNFHSGMTGTVVVTGSGSGSGSVWFSPANPTMYAGQSLAVSINSSAYASNYFGSQAYYISSNSNPSAVSASVSGTVLNLYANQSGSSSITVCHSGLSGVCGTLYVTVTGSGSGSGNISFSQNNVNLGYNQSQTVYVYGNYGTPSFYISNNSNPNAVSASLSGNAITLYGQNSGNSTLTVCQSGYSGCGLLYVNVGGGYGGNLSLSQYSLNLTRAESSSVTAYNNSSPLTVSITSNASVADAAVNGNTVNIYGRNPGSTTVRVCQSYGGACADLNVTVSYTGGGSGGQLCFQTASLPTITVGQYYSHQLQVSGGSYPYNFYVQSGSLPSGLSLSSSGLISGTVYTAQSSNFTVRVNDSFGRSATANFYLNAGGVAGASTYKNGQLIRENGTIYIVYRNTKSGFANWSAFTGFGFNANNVLFAGNSGLANTGYTISTSNTSHPWGSWIKSEQTVYFVHETGLIPIPDWNTFLNNGGQAAWIVNANSYDLNLTRLSPMVYNDSRLN